MAWRGPASKKATNPAPNPVQHGNAMSGEKKTIQNSSVPFKENRANQVRRDKDKELDFSVKLIDIDSTILSYLDTVINPTIVDAGRQVKVPIIYSSPERWKAIRKDGAIRDHNGKFQTPAIAFRRTTMQRNDSLITFNRYLQYPVMRKFSEKNKYDKFSLMNDFAPTKEIYSVAMPDHVIINYDFIVWTELVEQANGIVEGINFSTEDYWGDKNRFKFRTSISDYNFETTVDAGQDRVVRTTFSLMVYAYLLPDKYENYKSVIQKSFTTRKVVINFDAVVSGDFPTKPSQSLELFSVSSAGTRSPVETTGFNSLPSAAAMFGIADRAFIADFAVNTENANNMHTTNQIQVGGLVISGSGSDMALTTGQVSGVSGSLAINSIAYTAGDAAKWLVSINDGGTNSKTSEVVVGWANGAFNFYVTEIAEIGSVPVSISVNNAGSQINLVATPLSGTWNVKYIQFVI